MLLCWLNLLQNIGPAGVTIVIIRNNLIGNARCVKYLPEGSEQTCMPRSWCTALADGGGAAGGARVHPALSDTQATVSCCAIFYRA